MGVKLGGKFGIGQFPYWQAPHCYLPSRAWLGVLNRSRNAQCAD